MTQIVLEETSDLSGNGKKSLLRGKNGALLTSGVMDQAIPDSEDATALAAQWGNFAGINWAGGDFVTSVPGLNGQSITVLSASPLTTGESSVVNVNQGVLQPAALEVAASFVRTGISFATASLFANDPVTGPDPVPSPINIVSYYQSSAVQGAANTTAAGTVMHMLLETALPAAGTNQGVFIGDWINITGLVDTRFNYPNACINYISPDRKTIAVGFTDEAALPSLVSPASGVTTPTLGTAKVNFYNNMSGARNGFGLRLTGATATSGAIVSIFGGDDNQVSGTLLGDHRVTIGTTAPTYAAGANWGQYEIRASTRFMLEAGLGASVIMDKAEQTQAQWAPRDIPRTSVKPASGAALYPRFRLYKPVSMSRPVCKIVKAEKLTASAVATIYTDVAHGLTTGNYVTIKGIRDFATNYPPLTTPAAVTVVDTTTFTVTIGAAAIATSYGGSVVIANGGKDQPGIISQTVQSVQSRVADGSNWLDVIGSATWAGINPGDYIDLHGVRDNTTGADLGIDGAWEVAHLATTTMTLKPVFNIAGVRVSPALGTLGSTNCGGTVVLRPTLRSHDLSVTSWAETKITIDGQGTVRTDKALPVAFPFTPTVTLSSNAPVLAAGTANVGYVGLQIPLSVADVASAALTTTTTTAAVTPTFGTSYQVNIPVTAVTGTSPTLDVSIEESDDSGTNWFKVYDFPRITATGMYRSPKLPLVGNRVRYVQTVGGTTPSFTRTVNRSQSSDTAPALRQIFDRSIVLTTLSSTTPALLTEGTVDIKLTVNIGAATTAPVLQLQVSEDAVNWSDVGTPLTAVANTTVQTVAYGAYAKFARAIVKTAGVTVTAGFVQIKGF